MTENYITRIFVQKSRNVENFDIPLLDTSRQHLIFTGKNGSGKTSLLLEINKYLTKIDNGEFQQFEQNKNQLDNFRKQLSQPNITEDQKLNLERSVKDYENWIQSFGGTTIEFSGSKKAIFEKSQSGSFILAFFDSKRHTNLNVPQGINKVEIKKKYNLNEKANVNFIQYIVNLKADRSFARDDNEMTTVADIDAWFNRLESRLKDIFDANKLELRFDRKTYNFDVIIDDKQPFSFNTLSDGYSAIISIITELLLRMEAHNVKSYDLEGVVIIDEIETHLHVDLQKKILPFLTDFFPKIQFIVSTHSPFVLSSLSNVTICDLESKLVTQDLSGYSYDALIESYFQTDKYSEEIKEKIIEFDFLVSQNNRTVEQNEKLRFLRNYFVHTPKYLSTELLVKLQQIELTELNSKK
jgi:predicted ATPase